MSSPSFVRRAARFKSRFESTTEFESRGGFESSSQTAQIPSFQVHWTAEQSFDLLLQSRNLVQNGRKCQEQFLLRASSSREQN
jgi:hypothetical protein